MSSGRRSDKSTLELLQDRWGKRPGSLSMPSVLGSNPDDKKQPPDDPSEVVTRVTPRGGGIGAGKPGKLSSVEILIEGEKPISVDASKVTISGVDRISAAIEKLKGSTAAKAATAAAALETLKQKSPSDVATQAGRAFGDGIAAGIAQATLGNLDNLDDLDLDLPWLIIDSLPTGTYADLFKHGGAADLPAWAYRAAVAQLTYKKHKEIDQLAGLTPVCPMCAALVDSIGKLSVMWLDQNIAFNAISRFDRSVKICKVCERSEGAISRNALHGRKGRGQGHTWQTLTEFRRLRIDAGIEFFQEGAARHAIGHFKERDRRRDKIGKLAAQLAQHDQEAFDRLFVRNAINYWL